MTLILIDESQSTTSHASFREVIYEWENSVQMYSSNQDGINAPKSVPAPEIENFPTIISNLCRYASKLFAVSPMYIFVQMLGAMNCATRGYYWVNNGRYISPANLFIIQSALSGYGKSPANKFSINPHEEFQHDYNNKIRPLVEDELINKKFILNRIKYLESKSSKTSKINILEKYKSEIIENQNKLKTMNSKYIQLFADDTTIPALIKILSEQNERIAIMSGELGILRKLINAGNNSDYVDKLLRFFNGEPIHFNRKTEEPILLKSPIVSICNSTQPSTLKDLIKNEMIVESGLKSRFLIHIADERNVGNRIKTKPHQLNFEYMKYSNIIKIILEKVHNSRNTREVLNLTPAAEKIFQLQTIQFEHELQEGGYFWDIPEWGKKANAHLISIATFLHLYENYNLQKNITEETIRTATILVYWFADNMKSFYRYAYPEKSKILACTIAQKILEKNIYRFSTRDMQRLFSNISINEINEALHELYNYRGIDKINEHERRGPGRPASQCYNANFLILQNILRNTSI
jgi:hypothetical protein